jgi:hypothetical protein
MSIKSLYIVNKCNEVALEDTNIQDLQNMVFSNDDNLQDINHNSLPVVPIAKEPKSSKSFNIITLFFGIVGIGSSIFFRYKLSEKTEDYNELMSKNNDIEYYSSDLTDQLRNERRQYDDLKTKLTAQINDLKSNSTNKTKELEVLKSQLTAQTREFDCLKSQLEQKLTAKTKEVDGLKSQLEQQLTAKTKEIDDLKSKIDEYSESGIIHRAMILHTRYKFYSIADSQHLTMFYNIINDYYKIETTNKSAQDDNFKTNYDKQMKVYNFQQKILKRIQDFNTWCDSDDNQEIKNNNGVTTTTKKEKIDIYKLKHILPPQQ